MRPRIFVTQPIADSALKRLRKVATVKVNPDASRIIDKRALIAAVRQCDILFSRLHDKVDRDVLAANPKLRAVNSMTITPDNTDVAAATELGIPVTVVPPMVVEATADIAFALMLAVARRLVEGDRLVRKGTFPGAQSNHLGGAWVNGKTLGLVGGGGRIGKAVARRARGFSMRVLYWGPRRKPESGASELRLMKKTAYLINTARGPVVDEAALARALARGQIAGAGLDVFEHEPKVERALLKMSNVVLTPHLGSAVLELREQMAHIVVDNVFAILEGKVPPNCINPQVFAARAAAK
jgi:glyoxylate reductase